MAKLSSRSREVAEHIRDRRPFQTHGALRATEETERHGLGPWDSGQLAGADLDRYREDMREIRYAIWSYSTPIAWWTESRGWHIVAQRFSMTTSHHQGKLYLIP